MFIVEGNGCVVLGFGARTIALSELELETLGAWLRDNRPSYVEPVLERPLDVREKVH